MSTSKVILVSILTSLITCTALFFGLSALSSGTSLLSRKVQVPSVKDLRPDQARMLLESRRLLLVISGEEEVKGIAPGHIMRQNPFGGSNVLEGSSIHVTLAKGSGELKVPDLSGLPLTAAMQKLTSAGFQVGVITKQAHVTIEEGQVIASIPPTGLNADPGSSVNLLISAGQEQFKVPKVVGSFLAQAKKDLESAGFQPGKVTYSFDEDRRGGVVLRQNPADDSMAAKGAAVDLVVNETD